MAKPQIITTEELVKIIEKSTLDTTVKAILIRDIKKEGVTEFLLEQVIAYCDNVAKDLEKHLATLKAQNPSQ